MVLALAIARFYRAARGRINQKNRFLPLYI
jgi:hypothetical protein